MNFRFSECLKKGKRMDYEMKWSITSYLAFVYELLWKDYLFKEDRNMRRVYALVNVVKKNQASKYVLALSGSVSCASSREGMGHNVR